MIDKTPSTGNWTWYLEEGYADKSANVTGIMSHDAQPVRNSCVLDLHGNPMQIDIPRRKIGFNLPHQHN